MRPVRSSVARRQAASIYTKAFGQDPEFYALPGGCRHMKRFSTQALPGAQARLRSSAIPAQGAIVMEGLLRLVVFALYRKRALGRNCAKVISMFYESIL
jgi:hypothetical protein